MDPASAALDRPENPEANNSVANAELITNVADRMLSYIRALAPEIRARAAEIEAGRRIPSDLMERLRSIGVFRALVPRSHGGLELDMPAAMRIARALFRSDDSIGWITLIGMGCTIFASKLPLEVYEQIYQKGPDVIMAGSTQAKGAAVSTAGGWRVSGRWPFASGCQDAEWMFGLCIMSKDGKPLREPPDEDSPPMILAVMLPANHWQIEDTWHVAGLKGTGSHHIVIEERVAPEANFFDLMAGQSCLPGPLYQAVRHFVPVLHIAAAIGIAEGAMAELVELANTGRQQQRATTPMRDSELFQHELGHIEAELRAARAYADAQTESHWHHALAGTLKDVALLMQGTQAATWITEACLHVVDECFRLAGGSALYETSPLQRRMRDLRAAAQHAAVHRRMYSDAGRLLLERWRAEAGISRSILTRS
jgi:alkylation response protein AidB-like acyl-CoA dehydrogenase